MLSRAVGALTTATQRLHPAHALEHMLRVEQMRLVEMESCRQAIHGAVAAPSQTLCISADAALAFCALPPAIFEKCIEADIPDLLRLGVSAALPLIYLPTSAAQQAGVFTPAGRCEFVLRLPLPLPRVAAAAPAAPTEAGAAAPAEADAAAPCWSTAAHYVLAACTIHSASRTAGGAPLRHVLQFAHQYSIDSGAPLGAEDVDVQAFDDAMRHDPHARVALVRAWAAQAAQDEAHRAALAATGTALLLLGSAADPALAMALMRIRAGQ
jgi:hypothetical protein